jgi:Family of unknown function (DUF5362)
MVVPYAPPPVESAEGLVTRLAGRVKGATGWMKFLGVVYVVGGALGALAIVLLLIAGAVIDQFQGQLGEDLPANLTGYLIGYLVLTVGFVALYIWLGVVLWQASDGIRDAHRSGAVAELERGLSKIRVFFVAVGIITLVALTLGIIFFVLSFTVASSFSSSFAAATVLA